MKKPDISPAPILDMARAYCNTQALYTAARLKIFTVLSGKSMALAEAAASLRTPPRGAERLLNACCALQLLEKENGRYRNSALSEKFLVEGKETYLGYIIFHAGELYERWEGLLDAVKKDRPTGTRFTDRVGSAEAARSFTLAMHSHSQMTAPLLAAAVDLSRNTRLLDVGCGSGINAITLAEKNPRLEAVVYDFPAVIKVAREFISRSAAAGRIKLQAGDYTKDDLPKGVDCILLSHVIHAEGEKAILALLKKCYHALEPSGRIIIADFVLNEAKDGPPAPALFALNMLIATPEGNTFTAKEISRFLEDSGFRVEEVKPLGASPVTMVTAAKAAPEK